MFSKVLVLLGSLLALGSKSTSVSAEIHMSPDCMIGLAIFFDVSSLFLHVDVVTICFRLGPKSTFLSPGFCGHISRQYNSICWELNLILDPFLFPG